MVYDMQLWSRITAQNMAGDDILKQHTLFQAIRSEKSLRYYQETQRQLQNSVNMIDMSKKITLAKFDLEKSVINSRRTEMIRDKLRIARRSRELRKAGIPSLADLVHHRVPDHEMSSTSWASDDVPRYVRRYDFKDRQSNNRGNIISKGNAAYDFTAEGGVNCSETNTGKSEPNSGERAPGNRRHHTAKTKEHGYVNCNRTTKEEIGDSKYSIKTKTTLPEALQENHLTLNGVNQPETKEYETSLDGLHNVLNEDNDPTSLDVTLHRRTPKFNVRHTIDTVEAKPFRHKLQSPHKFLTVGASRKASNLDFIFKLEHRASENDLEYFRDMNRRRALKILKADFNELSKLVNNFRI